MDDHPSTLILGDEGPRGQIVVDMQAFFEFSFELAEQLEELVQSQLEKQERLSGSCNPQRGPAGQPVPWPVASPKPVVASHPAPATGQPKAPGKTPRRPR